MNARKENASIIFMKAPRLGKVKTRLQPQLSPEITLALYRAMGKDLVNHFSASKYFDLFIQFFPPDAEGEMRRWLGNQFNYVAQNGASLGDKLQHAFAGAFADGYRRVCIIGSDLPTLQQNDIRQAFEKLDTADVVLAPAADGGYYLVALKENHPELFEDIDWSTGVVFQQSLEKARQNGLSVAQLEMKEDLDTYRNVVDLWNRISEGGNKFAANMPLTIRALKKIFGE